MANKANPNCRCKLCNSIVGMSMAAKLHHIRLSHPEISSPNKMAYALSTIFEITGIEEDDPIRLETESKKEHKDLIKKAKQGTSKQQKAEKRKAKREARRKAEKEYQDLVESLRYSWDISCFLRNYLSAL